ncbi:MAG: hypothetical protein WBW62_03430 [Solirubrobacterales bacterium]
MKKSVPPDAGRLHSFVESDPLLSRLAAENPERGSVYLAGGAVRDVLAGLPVADFDLVVEHGASDLALSMAQDALIHERFGTAELEFGGTRIDVATARRETYAHPGALPEVDFPVPIVEDLARRDFTINAMAVSLAEPAEIIDPFDGQRDLERGVLRVLHERSFVDDPTRALRAARYAARFDFALDPATADLLADVDLQTVSRDRVEHELKLIAAELTGVEALRLVAVWGLIDIETDRLDTAAVAVAFLNSEIWRGRTTRSEAVLEAAFGQSPELPVETPALPSAGVTLADALSPAQRLVNRARGVEWLDTYEEEWSTVRLSISGDDLVLAGLPQGPAIGAGLAAALKARLDRGVEGIDAELKIAVEAAEKKLSEIGGPE